MKFLKDLHLWVIDKTLVCGAALEEDGRTEDADDQYLKAIKVGGPANWFELAKTRRTELGQMVLLERGGELRPDVTMYITGSIVLFFQYER